MLNQGKLSWATMQGRDYEKHKTAVTRVSKSGKKQFQGRKPQLKASQYLACGGIYTFFWKNADGFDGYGYEDLFHNNDFNAWPQHHFFHRIHRYEIF